MQVIVGKDSIVNQVHQYAVRNAADRSHHQASAPVQHDAAGNDHQNVKERKRTIHSSGEIEQERNYQHVTCELKVRHQFETFHLTEPEGIHKGKEGSQKDQKIKWIDGENGTGNELYQERGAEKSDDDDHPKGHHHDDFPFQFIVRSDHFIVLKS
jgi:hypothetical protein